MKRSAFPEGRWWWNLYQEWLRGIRAQLAASALLAVLMIGWLKHIVNAKEISKNKVSPALRRQFFRLILQLLPLVCGASTEYILQVGPLRLLLHLGTTCAAVSLTTTRGKELWVHNTILCQKQWRRDSYSVLSGAVCFWVCSCWPFVFIAQQNPRSPAGHAKLEITGVRRNYC